jgi:hypothetical protein
MKAKGFSVKNRKANSRHAKLSLNIEGLMPG